MGFLFTEYKLICVGWVMQNFESFENIFTFFVQSFYNKDYVEKIDHSVSNDTIDEETKLMIEQVKAFHTMRHEMCTKIFDYLSNNKLLHISWRMV